MTKKEILAAAREVLEIEARRRRRSGRPAGRRLRPGRRPHLPDQGPDHRHRHGQVGPGRPQDRRHPGQLRHAGHVRPSGRGRARRPGHDPQGRRHPGRLLQRRDARDRRSARLHQADRRQAHLPDREPPQPDRPLQRHRPRRPRRARGRAERARPDGQLHGRPGPGRRPGHRGDDEEGPGREGFRPASIPRAPWARSSSGSSR